VNASGPSGTAEAPDATDASDATEEAKAVYVTAAPPLAAGARRPGRPRDARADTAILAAAGEVLAEQGLPGFTVDAVAARAGVAKATIYRRWPSRSELLLETAVMAAVEVPDPDTGSLREDLVTLLQGLAHKMRDTLAGQILPAVVAEAAVNPEMKDAFAVHVCDRRERVLRAIRRGMDRGELRDDVDPSFVADLLGGPIFMRVLMIDAPIDDALVETTVDAVLYGLTPR
jgi:AcrR family transcriptional regulator